MLVEVSDGAFDEWLVAVDLDAPAAANPQVRTWAWLFYEEHGPLDPVMVRLALDLRTIELLEWAMELVRADVAATTSLHPRLEIRTESWGAGDIVFAAYNGSYRSGAGWPFAERDLLVELADYLRDHVVEDLWRAWPLCPAHGEILYPEIAGADAVWMCRRHGHAAARIGSLAPPSFAAAEAHASK